MDKRCPRGLKCLPSKPCEQGREAVDAARQGKEGGCPWFVADRESNYCIWKYLADDGRPTDPAKIARLLMIDDSEVKKVVQAFKKKINEDGESTPSE